MIRNLELNWDKTFPKSNLVNHKKVIFNNRFGIELVGDMYIPKTSGKYNAVAVCGPFGAVKEQASGLYAQELAERGFLTIAFDPSYTGESGGYPRDVASPDINTEDFLAAVDYLSTREDVIDIGILGICGWGGLALNAATLDTRIKATCTATMYDMSRLNAYGYFDQNTEEDRYRNKTQLCNQRTEDFKNRRYKKAGGVSYKQGDPSYIKDYYDYYKGRAYHKRSLNSNDGWNFTGCMSYVNQPILAFSNEIRSAVLMVHGEKAHSLYFTWGAFSKLKGNNKDILIVPNAVHTDLYDNKEMIPFDDIEKFYNRYLTLL